MIKMVCLFNRRPGMSLADFKSYYEEKHVPLITRLMPYWTDYRRNYRVEGTTHRAAHMDESRPTEPEFDVMTELTYASEEIYRKVLDVLADPVLGRTIAEDEAKFLDRSTMRVQLVDECRSGSV